MNRRADGVRRLLAAGLLVVGAAAPADAQSNETLFERLGLDRLQLTALGVSVGVTAPAQAEATPLYELNADYGELAPGWRVVFTASYWRSRFSDDVVREFADSVGTIIVDPSGDDTIRVGRVTVSDIALGVDLRWTPRADPVFHPYIGGGVAAHVVNAEGWVIDGTFVERALDNITAGIAGVIGMDIGLFPHFAVGVQARYDLLSGTRFGSVRAGASYRFGPVISPEGR